MRSSGIKVDAGPGVLDIVGTGGDRRVRGRASNCRAGAHVRCCVSRAALERSTSPPARASSLRRQVRGWPSTATARCPACAAAATWSRSWAWRCVQPRARFGRRSPLSRTDRARARGRGGVRSRSGRRLHVCAALPPSHEGVYPCLLHAPRPLTRGLLPRSMWRRYARRWACARRSTSWGPCSTQRCVALVLCCMNDF